MSKGMRTEDEVRDSAKLVLGFDKEEPGVQQGTGQITTFNQLGFRGCNDKPDGWYLPDDASKPAIILETKSEAEGVSKEDYYIRMCTSQKLDSNDIFEITQKINNRFHD